MDGVYHFSLFISIYFLISVPFLHNPRPHLGLAGYRRAPLRSRAHREDDCGGSPLGKWLDEPARPGPFCMMNSQPALHQIDELPISFPSVMLSLAN